MSLYYVKYWKLDKHIQVKSIKDARISVKHIFVKIGNVLIYLFCWLWHFIFTKMKFTRILLACYKSFLLAGWQIQISKYKKKQSLISWKLTYYTSWDFLPGLFEIILWLWPKVWIDLRNHRLLDKAVMFLSKQLMLSDLYNCYLSNVFVSYLYKYLYNCYLLYLFHYDAQ